MSAGRLRWPRTGRGDGSALAGAALMALALVSWPAAAGVRIETLPDGTRLMVGDGERRAASVGPPAGLSLDLDPLIEAAAGRHGLDPDLIRAVIAVESGYNPRALSRKGAMGLMQLMPATARLLSVRDPYDPGENIAAGSAYLKDMLVRFDGRMPLALAGYNAGPEAVQRFGGVPPYPETLEYVQRVLRIYRGDPGYSLRDAVVLPAGRKTFLLRDAGGRLVMTTTPPAGR